MATQFIPKPVTQTLGLLLMASYLVLIGWALTSSESITAIVLAVFAGVPIVGIVFLLRRFTKDMPSIRTQLQNDPLISKTTPSPQRTDLASPWSRILAFLIDRALMVVGVLIATMPFAIADSMSAGTVVLALTGIWAALIGIPSVLYAYFRDGIRGQSLGRRWLKQRVILVGTNEPIGFWRSGLRDIFLHFSIFLPIELILLFVGKNRARLGDMAAKTIVISTTSSEKI